MKKSNLQMMFQDNPTVMTGLLSGESVDVGDGLSLRITSFGGYQDNYTNQGYVDTMNFEVSLENGVIGDIDETYAGYIEGCEDDVDDWRLFESVVKRMCELFPKYSRERLDLDQNGDRISD